MRTSYRLLLLLGMLLLAMAAAVAGQTTCASSLPRWPTDR